MSQEFSQGPGISTLKPAGHNRREQLAKRADNLAKAAEVISKESEVYSIDKEKLKEDPEILRHFNYSDMAFSVTNPKKGRVYYWERNNSRSIAWRKGQARMLLGPKYDGWEVISGHDGQCTGGRRCNCEAPELMAVDGTRQIGDVLLMSIDLDAYVAIQTRLKLMNKFRQSNIAQKLSDFVRENEGLVQVHTMVGQTPREYFAKQGHDLVHTSSQEVEFPSMEARVSEMVGSEEE